VAFRLLLYGDLHLTPAESKRRFERPDLAAAAVDAVVTIGDVVDDNVDHGGRDARRHERRARAFFEHLDGYDVPVVAVPGDRDPVGATERLTQGLDGVEVAHGRLLRERDLPGDPDLEGCALVGVGCEQFDVSPTFPYMAYQTIDPRTTTNQETIGWVADDVADQVEAAVSSFLSSDLDVDGVADELGVKGTDRGQLASHLGAVREEFVGYHSLLSEHDGPTLLLSHVSPFNTEFDYHHSFEDLTARVHRGSIPLKMAVAATAPTAVVSGHVHQRGRDVLDTVAGPRVAYNPGSPGVAVLEIDPEGGTLSVTADPF
jgi:Icc-related predicted phosphoesterase